MNKPNLKVKSNNFQSKKKKQISQKTIPVKIPQTIKKVSPKIEAIDTAYFKEMRMFLIKQNLVDLMSYEVVNSSIRDEEHWIKVIEEFGHKFIDVIAIKRNGKLEVVVFALKAPINLTKIDVQKFRRDLIENIDPMYETAQITLLYSKDYDKPLPVYDFKRECFTGDRTHNMWI